MCEKKMIREEKDDKEEREGGEREGGEREGGGREKGEGEGGGEKVKSTNLYIYDLSRCYVIRQPNGILLSTGKLQ